MRKKFVLEAVMLAIYGELLSPAKPTEYVIPASTIYELEEIEQTTEPIMPDQEDDRHVRGIIRDMIQFFDDPFKRKKMEKSLIAPWSTVTFPFSEEVQLTIIKSTDSASWGELFDPIETQLILTAMRLHSPILTDQVDWQERLLEHEISVQFYDIEDFEFAVEAGLSLDDYL